MVVWDFWSINRTSFKQKPLSRTLEKFFPKGAHFGGKMIPNVMVIILKGFFLSCFTSQKKCKKKWGLVKMSSFWCRTRWWFHLFWTSPLFGAVQKDGTVPSTWKTCDAEREWQSRFDPQSWFWYHIWSCEILLMEEILHQLIGSLSHYFQGFIHPRYPRWCRISSINSSSTQDIIPVKLARDVTRFRREIPLFQEIPGQWNIII